MSLEDTTPNNGIPLVIDASQVEDDSLPSSTKSYTQVFGQEQQASFADIIADAIVKANLKSAAASETASSFSHPYQQLGVTGITLTLGLEVLHVSRSGSQQESARGTSKHSCGDTESARLKRKKTDKLACNNALGIITADDIAKHDLAAGCQQCQVGIISLTKVLLENDMLSPFSTPATFDLDDPTKLAGPLLPIWLWTFIRSLIRLLHVGNSISTSLQLLLRLNVMLGQL